jgi:hypothetical protein
MGRFDINVFLIMFYAYDGNIKEFLNYNTDIFKYASTNHKQAGSNPGSSRKNHGNGKNCLFQNTC